jgi:hypothetical protein
MTTHLKMFQNLDFGRAPLLRKLGITRPTAVRQAPRHTGAGFLPAPHWSVSSRYHYWPSFWQLLSLLCVGALPGIAAAQGPEALDHCLRRINIFTGNSDDAGKAIFDQLDRSGVLDCDCDFWVFATQVHGYCHHPTQVGMAAKGIVKTDPVGEMVRELRKRHPQARVVAYMHPRTTYVLESHPEWRAINAFDGKPIDSAGPVACLSTGFVEREMKPYLKELIEKYNFDGFWFDGACLNYDECGCTVCRADFTRETGMPFLTPTDRNELKPNYLRWMEWRLSRHERYYDVVTSYVRTLKPDATVQILSGAGRAWLTGEARPAASESFMRRASESCLEFFWHVDGPGDPVYSHFNAQMGRGVSGRLSEGWTPPTVHGTDSVGVPREELMARVWTMLVNGVVPQLPAGGWSRTADRQGAFRQIKSRQAYFQDVTSLKYAALVATENTDLALPRKEIRAGLLPETLGIYRMLIEEHFPVDVIGRLNLERDDLSAYRVIVLPEHYVLSAKSAARIREYVDDGGGLVCSGRSGLFSPVGATLPNFTLAEVLGADYVSFSEAKDLSSQEMILTLPADYAPDDLKLQRSIPEATAGMGSGYGQRRGVTFWGNTVTCRPTSAKAIMSLQDPRRTGTTHPFLLRNSFGKGRVSHLAARVGESYDKFSYPYLRRIVAREMEWVVGGKPPVRVQAPLSVRATYWVQPNGGGKQRLVIHLLNETAGQGRAGLTRGSWPIREDEVTLAGLKLELSGPFAGWVPVTRPEGKPLGKEGADAYLLPLLGHYQMITAQEP